MLLFSQIDHRCRRASSATKLALRRQQWHRCSDWKFPTGCMKNLLSQVKNSRQANRCPSRHVTITPPLVFVGFSQALARKSTIAGKSCAIRIQKRMITATTTESSSMKTKTTTTSTTTTTTTPTTTATTTLRLILILVRTMSG